MDKSRDYGGDWKIEMGEGRIEGRYIFYYVYEILKNKQNYSENSDSDIYSGEAFYDSVPR